LLEFRSRASEYVYRRIAHRVQCVDCRSGCTAAADNKAALTGAGGRGGAGVLEDELHAAPVRVVACEVVRFGGGDDDGVYGADGFCVGGDGVEVGHDV